MMKEAPVVYAVEKEYQIVFRVCKSCLCTVTVGERTYTDDNNGVMRSASDVHRVRVPMQVLDAAKDYTISLRAVTERKPYFSQTEEPQDYTFSFRPIPKERVRALHLSDVHGHTQAAIEAASAFGKTDLLILNGDLANHCDGDELVDTLFAITSQITMGEIPVVYARGNHDTRGNSAERLTDYIPTFDGHTYYTFRLGGLWGLVLDCGEDKPDDHAEYGHTVAFHAFRERETDFLEAVANSKAYEEEGIHTRLVIVHNPFTHLLKPPFDIEQTIYRRWATVLKESIKPDMMLCGHLHKIGVHEPMSEFDHLSQPCILTVGGELCADDYSGVGFVFSNTGVQMSVASSNGQVTPMQTVLVKGN